MARAKILVVDDNSDFRALVRFALERDGYDVTEADNGLKALAALDRMEPDLVLIDVNMPIMTGPEFVLELRRRGDQRPFGVVTMSGTNPSSSPTEWFIPKPIDVDLLLGVVGDFCGRRGVSPLWVQSQQRESLDALALRALA